MRWDVGMVLKKDLHPSVRREKTRCAESGRGLGPNPTCWLAGGSVVKKPPANSGDTVLIPGSGRSPGGNSNPLQYPCLENPMNRGAWWAIVCGVAKGRTQLSMHTHMSTNQPEAMGWDQGKVPCGLGVCMVWAFFCWHQGKEGSRGFLGISQWEADRGCPSPGSFSFWPQTGGWNGPMLGGGTQYPHSSGWGTVEPGKKVTSDGGAWLCCVQCVSSYRPCP